MLALVSRKRFAAMDAADGLARRLIAFVTILVPPLLPAFCRAELPLFSLRHLHQRLAASKAHAR